MRAAVQDSLTREITCWDNRTEELKQQDLAGKRTRLSSGNGQRTAEVKVWLEPQDG